MSDIADLLLGSRVWSEEEGHGGYEMEGFISFPDSSLDTLLPGCHKMSSFPHQTLPPGLPALGLANHGLKPEPK